MPNLSARDLTDVQMLAEAARACRTDEALTELYAILESILQATSMVSADIDPGTGAFVTRWARGVPEQAPETWCRRYQRVDPFVRDALRRVTSGTGRVTVSTRVVPRARYVRTEFYNDFLRPQSVYHVLVIALARDRRPIGVIGLHRPAGARPFGTADVLKAELAGPLLEAAADHVAVARDAGRQQAALDAMLRYLSHDAILCLDGALRVTFATEAARRLLGPSAGERRAASLPPALLREARRALAAGRPGRRHVHAFRLWAGCGKTLRGFADAGPDPSGGNIVLVGLADEGAPRVSPARLTAFGLTAREGEVAALVAHGLTSASVAERLGLSVRTVENHLRAIYAKVDVHNRAALVARLAGE